MAIYSLYFLEWISKPKCCDYGFCVRENFADFVRFHAHKNQNFRVHRRTGSHIFANNHIAFELLIRFTWSYNPNFTRETFHSPQELSNYFHLKNLASTFTILAQFFFFKIKILRVNLSEFKNKQFRTELIGEKDPYLSL